MIPGAREARGIAVIIDVFRAFSVEAYLAANNAEKIIPIGDIDLAYSMKEKDPSILLIGERKGKIQPGFDYGNCPSDIEKLDFSGKTLVHTTSAGTQGIANAVGAREVIGGSLLTADAIVRYIKKKNPEEVSLVCMGLQSQKQTPEDNLCAEYIKAQLENKPLSEAALKEAIENLKVTSGAKFFDPARQDVFPEHDFELCCEIGKFDFILHLVRSEDGIHYMEKVKID